MIRSATLALLATTVLSHGASAADNCRDYESTDTAFGTLVNHSCRDDQKRRFHSITLGSREILREDYLSLDTNNKNRSIWIISGAPDAETGCARRLYLFDLSMRPVRLIAFGVKTACNELHWASWDKSRSVIALNKNVRFIYKDGTLIPPLAGERLFESVEPPHSSLGGGMTEDSAVPFVESVPLPK